MAVSTALAHDLTPARQTDSWPAAEDICSSPPVSVNESGVSSGSTEIIVGLRHIVIRLANCSIHRTALTLPRFGKSGMTFTLRCKLASISALHAGHSSL